MTTGDAHPVALATEGGRPHFRVRSADATTILSFFVALQVILPSRLVMDGLPLSLSAASLVALALGALWLCTQMTTTLGAAKGRNPVRTMLFAYFCVLLASAAWSAFGYLPGDERAIGDHVTVNTIALICLSLAVCDGVRSRERIYFLIRVLVVCSAILAFVGVLQFVLQVDLTPYLSPPGMHPTALTNSVGTRDGLTRAAGTTANPLEFGVYCAMALPLAIHLASNAVPGRHGSRFWWVCVGLIGGALLFSVSRSAIVGLVVAASVLFVGWTPRRRLRMLAAAGIGLLVVKALWPAVLTTLFELFHYAGQDSSIQWRTHDYATAKSLIAQHFWLGRGIGTWYAPKHEIFDNQYLLTLVDTGVLGLLAFLGIFIAAVYALARVRVISWHGPHEPTTSVMDRDLTLSLAASVMVVFPSFATFDFTAFPTVTALAFLLAGICGAVLRVVEAEVRGEVVDPYAIV